MLEEAERPPRAGFSAAANGRRVTAHYATRLGIWRGGGDECGLTSATGWVLCTFNVGVRGTEQGIMGRRSCGGDHEDSKGLTAARLALKCKKPPRPLWN